MRNLDAPLRRGAIRRASTARGVPDDVDLGLALDLDLGPWLLDAGDLFGSMLKHDLDSAEFGAPAATA